MEQALTVSGIVTIALAGLVTSNIMYDRGVPNSVSRVVAPLLGGLAFLAAVLWLDAGTAISLSCAMTLFILTVRLGFRRGLRGVAGDLPTQAWAEITYAMAGTVSLAVGWGLLGDRWLAFLPIAFMAWGDSVAGLLRASVWRGEADANPWPPVAMGWHLPRQRGPLPSLLDRCPRGCCSYRCGAPQAHDSQSLGRQPARRGYVAGCHGDHNQGARMSCSGPAPGLQQAHTCLEAIALSIVALNRRSC